MWGAFPFGLWDPQSLAEPSPADLGLGPTGKVMDMRQGKFEAT